MYGTGNITNDLYAYEEINTVYEEAGYVVHKLWPRFGTIKTSHYYNFSGSTKVGWLYRYDVYFFLFSLSYSCLVYCYFVIIHLIYGFSSISPFLFSYNETQCTTYQLQNYQNGVPFKSSVFLIFNIE